MGWRLRSGTFGFSFKWHFPAFLAKPRMAMIVSAMCPLPKSELRETTGPIQLVWSGIQLRISSSQVTGNGVNRNMSGTCLILPVFLGLDLNIRASGCSDQSQGRLVWEEEAPAGEERG